MNKKSLIIGKKNAYTKGDTNYFEVYFSDTNSCRLIYKKYIQYEDKLYTLTSQLDTNFKQSDFISTFYATFKPYSIKEKQDIVQAVWMLVANGISVCQACPMVGLPNQYYYRFKQAVKTADDL
jgi:hypothetical protein